MVYSSTDLNGYIGLYRDTFYSLGGYDEDHKGWGNEDHDLRARAKASRCRWLVVHGPGAREIQHSNELRFKFTGPPAGPAEQVKAWNATDEKVTERRLVANQGRSWGA